MKHVKHVFVLSGGLGWLKAGNWIGLEHQRYLRLVIEWIGKGPRGCDAISVTHYGEQDDDPMRDPEMVFEVPPDPDPPAWAPVYYRNDYVASEREAAWQDGDGWLLVRPALVKDLKTFARVWDRNLRQQGFLDVARARAEAAPESNVLRRIEQ
jgi:hypothetical protein